MKFWYETVIATYCNLGTQIGVTFIGKDVLSTSELNVRIRLISAEFVNPAGAAGDLVRI